jgi:hypothetical protein
VSEAGSELAPGEPELAAYPNPFNPAINLRLSRMPADRQVSVRIFDLAGRLVHDFAGDIGLSGYSRARLLSWNAGKNGSGLYIVKATSGSLELKRKVLLVK